VKSLQIGGGNSIMAGSRFVTISITESVLHYQKS